MISRFEFESDLKVDFVCSVVVEAIRGHTAYGLVAKLHEIVWPGLSVRKRGHMHVWLGRIIIIYIITCWAR